jgi:hypothetical protein
VGVYSSEVAIQQDSKGVISYIHDADVRDPPARPRETWLPPDPTGMFMFPRIPAELRTSYPVNPKMNRASFNEPALAQLEPS